MLPAARTPSKKRHCDRKIHNGPLARHGNHHCRLFTWHKFKGRIFILFKITMLFESKIIFNEIAFTRIRIVLGDHAASVRTTVRLGVSRSTGLRSLARISRRPIGVETARRVATLPRVYSTLGLTPVATPYRLATPRATRGITCLYSIVLSFYFFPHPPPTGPPPTSRPFAFSHSHCHSFIGKCIQEKRWTFNFPFRKVFESNTTTNVIAWTLCKFFPLTFRSIVRSNFIHRRHHFLDHRRRVLLQKYWIIIQNSEEFCPTTCYCTRILMLFGYFDQFSSWKFERFCRLWPPWRLWKL